MFLNKPSMVAQASTRRFILEQSAGPPQPAGAGEGAISYMPLHEREWGNMDKKKRVFSGIQPTNVPTIGNYLGAMRNWVTMQDESECLYCVVDLHGITIRHDPEEFRRKTRTLYAILLSCGLTPEKSVVYLQSHVSGHSELAWLLGCYTMFGELSRMTQFKDKSAKHPDNINSGLFTYPVLMAADILLFDTNEVPVGQDQKQHVELARNIAERFNHIYGDVLVVPEPVIPAVGAKINSLIEPSRKMDKSDPNPGAFISLTDDRDTVLKKFKKAVTDSDPSIRFDPENKPGVSNLMTIYSLATGKSLAQTEAEFEGRGYGVFKPAVGEAVDAMLAPIRDKTNMYLGDIAQLESMMRLGAERASAMSEPVLRRIRGAIGFVQAGD